MRAVVHSSVMGRILGSGVPEFQQERYAVRDLVHGNDLLRQFFRVFPFEDLPPDDRRPDDVYLDEAVKSTLYVSTFGNEYDWEDAQEVCCVHWEVACDGKGQAGNIEH